MRLPRGDDQLASRGRFDTSSTQRLDERGRRSIMECSFASVLRAMDDRPILRHDSIEHVEVGKDNPEVSDETSSDEDETPPRRS
jgi:hypothetical protein